MVTLAIDKPKVFESLRIRLTSPIVRIGGAVSQLNRFEYVENDRKVYLPDADALAKSLHDRGRLNDYIRVIENNESLSYLLKQTFGDNWLEIRDPENKPIFPKHTTDENWTKEITDLRPMIRNGFGRLYIPGTSIKGAIKTAIAYYLLKHRDRFQTPQRVRAIEEQLTAKINSGELKNPFKQKNAAASLFTDAIFTDFSLTYQKETYPTKNQQNRDFMRCLHVTDSTPLEATTLTSKDGKKTKFNIPVVNEVIVSSYFKDAKNQTNRAKHRASLYTEMVYNVRNEFTITLDVEMLQWFNHKSGMQLPFNNLTELLVICREFAQDQWDGEYDYWENIENNRDKGKNLDLDRIRQFYAKEQCPYTLRLGWGTGLNGTTIGLLLNENLRSQLRDVCGIEAPGFEAPKSRRTIVDRNGDIRFVPGWVKLSAIG